MASVIKEGFLVKKGHVRHNWRTRWFILLKCELLYFRTKRDKTPAGVVRLNGAMLFCPPIETSKKPWLLHLTTNESKVYMIQAPDQGARDDWKEAIEDTIRKLDPAKANRPVSPTRTLVRTETFVATNNSLREIVQAMQDRDAGVPLRNFKVKGSGSPNTKQYFTGKDAIDWLISWSFVEDRQDAVAMASEMTKYGFFNGFHVSEKENIYEKNLLQEMVDSEDSTYNFVVFAPGEFVELFGDIVLEEEGGVGGWNSDDSDSDLEEEIVFRRERRATTNGNRDMDVLEESQVLKQGFLLKKGRRWRTWKVRKFVLKGKDPVFTYHKGSKGNKVFGEIPLKDLTVLENVTHIITPPTTLPCQQDSNTGKIRNGLTLLTATGVRYDLEACNSDDRDSWASHIRAASKLC